MASDVKVWRYSFPSVKGEGWAIFFLDEAGCFSALSDYGDWSYRWNTRGLPKEMTFRHFLLECSDDYILRKIAPQREYDSVSTLHVIRDMIIGMRRVDQLSKYEARVEWDRLESYDTELPDTSELYMTKYSEQARLFLKHCLPRLRTALSKDLADGV
jgi:hypothetical protein